jgi:hypothetical protein
LKHLLADKSLKPWQRGIIDHAFADSYAHSLNLFGMTLGYPAPLGHLFALHFPDMIGTNPVAWQAYVNSLFDQLGGDRNNPTQMAQLNALLGLQFPFSFWNGITGSDASEIDILQRYAISTFKHRIPPPPPGWLAGLGPQANRGDIQDIINKIKAIEKSGCCDQ